MPSGIYNSFDELMTQKLAILERIRSTVLPLTDEQRTSSKAGSWSVQGILEHLVIVEEGTLALIGKLVERARKQEAPPSPFRADVSAKVAQYTNRKVKTKERYEPSGRLSVEDSLARLGRAEQSLGDLRTKINEINGSTVSFPHWELGTFTLNEWCAFLVLHEDRHARQIETIIG